MKLAKDYDSVMGRSAEIMKASLGLDFTILNPVRLPLTMKA